MSTPRRSARLASHPHTAYQQQQRPSSSVPSFAPTSQPSSTSTTSYPSPTDDSGQPTAHPPPSHSHSYLYQVQSSVMPQHHTSKLNAPLPSPSAGDAEPVFGRPHSQPNPYSSHPHQQHPQQASAFGVSPHQQPQQQYTQQHQQQHMHHNSFSQQNSHPGQPGHMPKDFLAEAARRAQMACLMRDLGDIS